MTTRRILFITGTRADFGKLKSLISVLDQDPNYDVAIFVTGMHTLKKWGYTVNEVHKLGVREVYTLLNHIPGDPMDMTLATTMQGLARYVTENPADMIVVHGDRVEALAGAIVGALRNVYVAHIEGGEISGTVDEFMRHSISKMSHFHFVSKEEAKQRLIQLGEKKDSVFVIGSPDMDVMLHKTLPTLNDVADHYELPFLNYGIALFHSVTTEVDRMAEYAKHFTQALLDSKLNYIVIFPNNDLGCDAIFNEYKKLEGRKKFRILPSVQFESFLTLLQNASFVVGNSSAGVREAPYYGVPTVDVGTRQNKRYDNKNIIKSSYELNDLLDAIGRAEAMNDVPKKQEFGSGNSHVLFKDILQSKGFWNRSKQKQFQDIRFSND